MTHDLRVERVYDAAPELVFDAFTDPGAQQEMYADEPDWSVVRLWVCTTTPEPVPLRSPPLT